MALNLTTPHESGPEVTLPVLHPNDPIIKDPEIFDWLLFLPRDPIDFVGAFDSPVPTVAQYQDFLHHCETRARTLLRYLDNFEYKYRKNVPT
jgi:hypothetical protein